MGYSSPCPLAELVMEMRNPKPITRKMVVSEATNIKKCLETMTTTYIANKLGLAVSTISDANKHNEVKMAYDIAAKTLLPVPKPPAAKQTDKVVSEAAPLTLDQLFQEMVWHFRSKTIFDLTVEETTLLNKSLADILKGYGP